MLKLTQCYNSMPIWVWPKSILSMFRHIDNKHTNISMIPGDIQVVETPEEILAMPEMIYETYPAMVVPPTVQSNYAERIPVVYGLNPK